MNRLTTQGKNPHGAEGVNKDRLTGKYCRGIFEATAIVERLAEYENTGLEPKEINALNTQWISVKDRLPERTMCCLVSLYDNGERPIGFGIFDKPTGKWFADYLRKVPLAQASEYGKVEVLAWMPLPESYKESEVEHE